jgi:hypothetical protein
MAAKTPADEDAGMPTSRPSSSEERSLMASAHALQRAAGSLQTHAADADQIPTLGTTLAHVEEALDRLSVGMLQMATGVVEWCGEQGLPADENALPPQARALCFHLRAAADALRAPQGACTSSRLWTRRLLDSRSDAEQEPYPTADDPKEHRAASGSNDQTAACGSYPSPVQS